MPQGKGNLPSRGIKKSKKRGTASSRKFHFEPFSQRISQLTIDPVRRVHQDAQHDALDSTASYFKTSLDHWIDLNFSETFTNFVRAVTPLSDSLPQVLHHRKRIVELLHQYLEQRDALSLEPLLALQAHLAHDLGARFEEYFPSTLTLVLSIAAKHEDVEVIEWSFSCLAWLFKYLSRLLVPDLRPTYDIVAAVLGKENRKPFIARFAAETMSFLMRKAALMYQKDEAPLKMITRHMFNDLAAVEDSVSDTQIYSYWLMNLLSNSIKGVDRGLHSTGLGIYECMMQSAAQCGGNQVALGVTINVIHHTNEHSFRPVLDCICNHVLQLNENSKQTELELYASMLYTIATVRSGSRIDNWQPLFTSIEHIFDLAKSFHARSSLHIRFVINKALTVAFHSAPFDVVVSNFSILDNLEDRSNGRQFLTFCANFGRLNPERLHNFIRSRLFKFIASSWDELEMPLLNCVYSLQSYQVFTVGQSRRPLAVCPKTWEERIVSTLAASVFSPDNTTLLYGYLELLNIHSLSAANRSRLLDHLEQRITTALEGKPLEDDYHKLLIGTGLHWVLRSSGSSCSIDWLRLCRGIQAYGSMPLYVQNMVTASTLMDIDGSDPILNTVVGVLNGNLSSPSSDLRKASLELLAALVKRRLGAEADILKTSQIIEGLSPNFGSARTYSMHVRQLAVSYPEYSSDPWIAKAIPHFCFGLLHVKLLSLWNDAIDTLRTVLAYSEGEDAVAELVFAWLEKPVLSQPTGNSEEGSNSRAQFNEFQCSHLSHIEVSMGDGLRDIYEASDMLRSRFRHLHTSAHHLNENCRPQALRVLKGLPELAEKRSRRLVPIFLRAVDFASQPDKSDGDHPTFMQDNSQGVEEFSRFDVKTLLDIFGSFVNPKVLYQAPEVYCVLLQLLSNGDAQIQRAALKAIATWKLPSLKKYQENFDNLLDDSRFREELALFVQPGGDESFVEDESQAESTSVLLRILFGRIISRQGTSSGKNSLASKRRAVFEALASFSDNAIREFLSLAFGPVEKLITTGNEDLFDFHDLESKLSIRQRVGLLNVLNDMLAAMGERLKFCSESLARAIFICSRPLHDPEARESYQRDESVAASTSKRIRRVAVQCFQLIFKNFPSNETEQFLPLVFKTFDSRLENLAGESAQSIPTMFRLFSTWAASSRTSVYLTRYDPRVLQSLLSILALPSAKDEVKIFVLDDILKPILAALGSVDDKIKNSTVNQEIIEPHGEQMLQVLSRLLEGEPVKPLLGSALETVSRLSGLVHSSKQIHSLIDLSSFLLRQPSHKVDPKSKGRILHAFLHFLPLSSLSASDQSFRAVLESVNPLFGFFKDRENRTRLGEVYQALAEIDTDLEEVANYCEKLNAFSTTTVDGLDFEKRFAAFQDIDENASQLSAKQWAPIIYNMLFYIKDTEELAIRTSASGTLKAFIHVSCRGSHEEGFLALRDVLLSALRNGASNPSELVRAEHLIVFAELIRASPVWDQTSDLMPLLVNDDQEASFFANVLHIQQHRRLRALRRLATEAGNGSLRSKNVAHFLIPLLEHFVVDGGADSGAHNLTAEAVTAIGTLAECLEWPQFRALFRRYSSYLQNKVEIEKPTVRLLSVLTQVMDKAATAKEITAKPEATGLAHGPDRAFQNSSLTLCRTMPNRETLSENVTSGFLPSLRDYIRYKDEALVSQRMPVAIVVVKLLKLLPLQAFAQHLPPVLTDICQVLRSKAQESRDLTRKTLAEVSQSVGPKYFGFILRELRSALPRGFQLHVLSYTVHSILLANEKTLVSGDLDYCLADIVAVIMDDTFGTIGQEKDAENYTSKMKEVKSNKSYDSMEIIAKQASMSRVNVLVEPLRDLLGEKVDIRMLRKADELFRRIGVGLLHNDRAGSRDGLVLCYEMLKQAYQTKQDRQPARDDERVRRYKIQVKSAKRTFEAKGTTSHVYKIARFALDLLRTIVNKYEVLRTPSKLSGFIPLVGEALLSAHEEVQTSALRLLAVIMKVPMKDLDSYATIYVTESVKLVKNATTTSSEAAQAALKLITAVLRERQSAKVRDTDITYLLTRVKDDIQEPDRQGVIFNFLKAVVHRSILIPEVYDVMDSVSAMMVTNQSSAARDMARGLHLLFFLTYPQTKSRLKKEIRFLVLNLEYPHVEGRQAIMEVLHQMLIKTEKDILQEIVATFFAPLVVVSINDDSPECRRMASTLLQSLLEKADDERLSAILALLRSWLTSDEQSLLTRAALQIFPSYLELDPIKGEKELKLLEQRLLDILGSMEAKQASNEWEVVYFSLKLIDKLCELYPQDMRQSSTASLWELVFQASKFRHKWVRLAASQLLGQYFDDFARTVSGREDFTLPIVGSGGLQLGLERMMEITKSSFRALTVEDIGEELATQLMKNLAFLGRLFGALKSSQDSQAAEDDWDGLDSSDVEDELIDGSQDLSDDQDEGIAGRAGQSVLEQDPLRYIFTRTSAILRRETRTTRAPALIPKTACVRLLTALCTQLPASILSRYLATILQPLHNLTDSSVSVPSSLDEGYNAAHEAMVTNAREIISSVQSKVGMEIYSRTMTQVMKDVEEKRNERRVKRRIEAVTEPERTAMKKSKKHFQGRVRRKEKNSEQRSKRWVWQK